MKTLHHHESHPGTMVVVMGGLARAGEGPGAGAPCSFIGANPSTTPWHCDHACLGEMERAGSDPHSISVPSSAAAPRLNVNHAIEVLFSTLRSNAELISFYLH